MTTQMKDMTKAMDQKVRERDELLVDILAKMYNFDAEDAKKQLWPSKADKAEATKKRVILSKEADLTPKEQKMYAEMKELAAATISAVEETPTTEVVAVVAPVVSGKKASSAPAAAKLILPFPGYKMEGKCCSIRPNHDLYTQCTAQVSEGTQFCGSCTKDVVAETGKPKYGTIEDRLACGAMDYHPAGCPKVKHYSRLMKEKKYQYTREQVCEEVARLGLVALDEWHFEEQAPAAKKKAVVVADVSAAVTISDEVSGEIASIKAKKAKVPAEAKKSKKAAKAETSEVPDLFKNLTVVDTSAQVVASAAEESSGEELEEDDYEEDA